MLSLCLVATVFLPQPTLAAVSYVSQFGSFGSGNGQFNGTNAIAVDSSGNLYVADYNNRRVQKFTSSGSYVLQFGTSGTGDGQFMSLSGIAIDSSGMVYVSDNSQNNIQRFTSTGIFLSKFGTTGSADGQLNGPNGIAFDSSNNLYVADTSNHRIQKFTSSGSFISKFGSQGTGNGQFQAPTGIAVDSSGNLYTSESGNNRVQKFTSAGTYVTQFSGGSMNSPQDIAVDKLSGNIFIANSVSYVSHFNSSGTSLGTIGSNGSGNSQFGGPQTGIAVDSAHNLYVSDYSNNRVQKFISTSAPIVTTTAASGIADVSATLNGSISDTGGSDATQHGFAYGTTPDLSTVIATTTIGAKSGAGSFSGSVAGLEPGTTYYVRAYATNSAGTGYGSIVSFVTNGPPTVVTEAASSVRDVSATLNGSISDTGGSDATQHGFAYGTTPDLSTVIATTTIGAKSGAGSFFGSVAGLEPGTTYYVRAYATNSAGTGYGSIVSFVAATPVSIATCEELQAISEDLAGVYVLSNDIDCTGFDPDSDGKGFIPIGSYDDEIYFTGTLNGNGHSILNLTINRPLEDGVGLFGSVLGGTYEDLSISGSVIGSSNVGSLVGYSYSGTLTVDNVRISSDVAGASQVGGIVGYSQSDLSIANSHFDGDITIEDRNAAPVGIGGLIGEMAGSSGMISGSSASGTIIIDNDNGVQKIGGLVGSIVGSSIANSSSTIDIQVITDNYAQYVGGIAGYFNNNEDGESERVFAAGDIQIDSHFSVETIGGLFGTYDGLTLSESAVTGNIGISSSGGEISGVGGLIGGLGDPTEIHDSFWTGTIGATSSTSYIENIGGILGENGSGGSIYDSYAAGAITLNPSLSVYNVGGYTGISYGGVIEDSFFASAINIDLPDQESIGALIGNHAGGTFSGSFYDSALSGEYACTGEPGPDPSGCTPIESDSPNHFKGNDSNLPLSEWDFDGIWAIVSGGYPTFSWLPASAPLPEAPAPSVPVASQSSSSGSAGYSSGGDMHIIHALPTGWANAVGIPLPIPCLEGQQFNVFNGTRCLGGAATSSARFKLIKDLYAPGSQSPEVLLIQRILNSDPATRVAQSGPGSPGRETNLYGPATRAAVQKFQLKHGIVKSPRDSGYGIVGPKTRAKMNEILGGR